MTKPKKWPHNAAWARDDAHHAINQALPYLHKLTTHRDTSVVANAAMAISKLKDARHALERVGAPAEH